MRAALARLAVTDRGARVNPQQKAMASVADFTAVEGLISELTDVLSPFQGGLKRQKLGESSSQHVHQQRYCVCKPRYRPCLQWDQGGWVWHHAWAVASRMTLLSTVRTQLPSIEYT